MTTQDRQRVPRYSLVRRSKGIKDLLRQRQTLIDAVILAEILGPPRARRSLQKQRPV